MRLFGARHKRLSAPDFSRILISSRNHCKSSKKFARPGTDDARRKLKPLMNTDEHGAAQPQPKNERLRTHWWQVWSSAFRLHWTEQAKARTPNLTAEITPGQEIARAQAIARGKWGRRARSEVITASINNSASPRSFRAPAG